MTTAGPDVGELFDAHAPDLLRYLRRRVGPDAAEDLLHETFLARLRREVPADPERGGERAWLFGTATNLARHHARGAGRADAAALRLAPRQRERWVLCAGTGRCRGGELRHRSRPRRARAGGCPGGRPE